MDHPIDLELANLSGSGPSDRLSVLWRAFERGADCVLSDPPTVAERAEVQEWLRRLRMLPDPPVLAVADRCVRTLAFLSVAEKASQLCQSPCTTCETLIRADGTIVLSLTTPVDVEPWSSQSNRDRDRIRQAVRQEMLRRRLYEPYEGDALCITIVSVLPTRRKRKDADNLVKGLLDALQGVLYRNDAQIQCLTSRRLEYAGPTGYYIVTACAVHPYGEDVVFDDGMPPRIVIGSRVDIEKGQAPPATD